MASQLSCGEKKSEQMNTSSSSSSEPTGTAKPGRPVLPPLSTLINIDSFNLRSRDRSCTMDSSSSSSLGTANTTPSTPYYTSHQQTQAHAQNQHPIHRPRAMLASAMSFGSDSGLETSPLFQKRQQFPFGESVAASISATAMPPPVLGGNNENASLLNNTTGNSSGLNLSGLDDSIEGDDAELIAIDHHFTPISVPAAIAEEDASTLVSGDNQAAQIFRFPSVVPGSPIAITGNLATERRANRLYQQQSYSMADYYYHHRQVEVNNNDPGFRNLNGSAPAASARTSRSEAMMFSFDDYENEDEDDDDDVFYNGVQEAVVDSSPPMTESRSWHIARPSCIIGGDAVDGKVAEEDEDMFKAAAPARSRRSSTPIAIPSRNGSTAGSTGASSSYQLENFFKAGLNVSANLVSPLLPSSTRTSDQDMLAAAAESFEQLLKSVPQPITRMPYYHQMAPPLIGNHTEDRRRNKEQVASGVPTTATTHRRTAFGTHFETSCSIIHGRWYPNPQAAVKHGSPTAAGSPTLGFPPLNAPSFSHLRFGRLPASPTYQPLRAIPTDFRVLTPHFEVDEEPGVKEKDETAASASYGKWILLLTFFLFTCWQ